MQGNDKHSVNPAANCRKFFAGFAGLAVSGGLQDGVALPAEAEFTGRPIVHGDEEGRIGNGLVIDPYRAFANLSLRLAVRCGEAHGGAGSRQPDAFSGNAQRRQILPQSAAFERQPGGFGGSNSGILATAQPCDLIGQDGLGVIDGRAFQGFESLDFIHRQVGKQAQELADIAVVAIAPVLPEIVPPSAVVSSGVVNPNTSTLSIRRESSTPLTMLPHWSDPPICRRTPMSCARWRKS